jgi:hypothetical protein
LTSAVPQGPSSSRVAVLIATFNGAAFLSQQLNSIERQSWPLIDVWASDDGSGDGTVDLLKDASGRWTKGRFEIVGGPRGGVVENFRSLLRHGEIDADFIAFSDQDDIWRLDKLKKAVDWLNGQDAARPALFCCRVELMDEVGQPAGFSPLFRAPPDLRNALVQSIAGGNTMVMNRAAHELLRETAKRTSFVIHDWWAYLIVAAAGGTIHYSPAPDVLYRQHGANVIGANTSWGSRLRRVEPLLAGRFSGWTNENLKALDACRDLLSPEAKVLIDDFKQMRRLPLVSRLGALRRLGLYRQTWLGQISLFAGCIFSKI